MTHLCSHPGRYLWIPVILLLLGGCDGNSGSTPATNDEKPIRPARMMTLETPSELASRRFSGRVEPAETTTLSFRVPGQIETLNADVGDEVSEGDTLGQLDQRDFRLQVRETESQLDSVRATLEEARKNWQRGKELVDTGAISDAEFDRLESAYEQARAKRNATREALETARSALDDTVLEAPFDGVINRRMVEPFEQVSPQRPVFSIDNIETVEVEVSIPERLMQFRNHLEDVHVYMPVLDNRIFDARVENVRLDVSPDTQAYPVRVAVNNPERELLPGMTAEVSFKASLTDTPWDDSFLIPVEALFEKEDQPHVWVWDPDSGEVASRPVTTESLEADSVRITGKISAGEQIVVAGAQHLEEGQKVSRLEGGVVQ
ncbi:efflux RND transporter periplasmic adaptor subunit [Vreelandella utahensis]|uniref:efflux RND transporter periplasmic adaptor subunit n=1 Tax=Vreelandella halophila TaxID=86177 RepID=UPI0015C3E2EA|nr:efflux RND transporter periplasmic adaptor subunit [Halomonas utahensis]